MKHLLALSCLAVGSTAGAVSFFDDFNRADAADLGANWTNMTGSIGIVGSKAQAPGTWVNVATVNGYSDIAANTAVSFDVFHNTQSITFAGAVLGYTGPTSSIFVKVQDNTSAGNFNTAYFYLGDNGSGGSFGFDNLNPFNSARVYVWFAGTTAFLGIDTNFDTVLDQTYSRDYGTSTFGTGAGLTAFGDALIDNYAINAVPEPATIAMVGFGFVALLRRRRA